ncbi:collagen alpha-1(I) chain-like [Prionailurus bengalensis]|uniref:collagen alpha-1(I) chain-like n=1 Tax=Prionailurus bengalensis TaxID=37029 RepID=UPI001CAA3CD1|nr:collagen alpha-1(I) chain-like [Prionailurus bengalensis]
MDSLWQGQIPQSAPTGRSLLAFSSYAIWSTRRSGVHTPGEPGSRAGRRGQGREQAANSLLPSTGDFSTPLSIQGKSIFRDISKQTSTSQVPPGFFGLFLHGTAGSLCPQAEGQSVSLDAPASHPPRGRAGDPGVRRCGEGPRQSGGSGGSGGPRGARLGPRRSSAPRRGKEPRRVPPPSSPLPRAGCLGQAPSRRGPAGAAGEPLRSPHSPPPHNTSSRPGQCNCGGDRVSGCGENKVCTSVGTNTSPGHRRLGARNLRAETRLPPGGRGEPRQSGGAARATLRSSRATAAGRDCCLRFPGEANGHPERCCLRPGGGGLSGCGREREEGREPSPGVPAALRVLGPPRGACARVRCTPNAHSPSHGATNYSSGARKRQRKKREESERADEREKAGPTPARRITYL